MRVTDQATEVVDRPLSEKYPESPQTVLVADDEHLVAVGMAASLRELGYTVIGPAADGEQAIEMCRDHQPDIALLDIRMPKKDGVEVARTVFDLYGIPVVIFSAFSDGGYVDSGNKAGVFAYLLKPVTQDQLRVGICVAWGRFCDFAEHATEIGRLKQRLEDRKLVEQAKWILVKRKSIDEPDAMRLLQRQARNNRKPLVDVARGLIENEALLGA